MSDARIRVKLTSRVGDWPMPPHPGPGDEDDATPEPEPVPPPEVWEFYRETGRWPGPLEA